MRKPITDSLYYLTVTRQYTVTPFAVAEILALPTLFALTFPFLLTETIPGANDLHFTFFVFPYTFAVNFLDVPTLKLIFFLFSFMAGDLTIIVTTQHPR